MEDIMAQLWGGRFTKETDKLAYQFNASIHFDRRFFEQDIEGSIAHAVMLEKQGILTQAEKDAIVKGPVSYTHLGQMMICRIWEKKIPLNSA